MIDQINDPDKQKDYLLKIKEILIRNGESSNYDEMYSLQKIV